MSLSISREDRRFMVSQKTCQSLSKLIITPRIWSLIVYRISTMKHLLSTLILWMSSCAIYTYAQEEMTDTLREVVVTGTGTQHLLKNAPVQTEVISRKMLDSYGGKSIEEILGGLTASFAFNEGDMGSQMQLGGLGNSYILILIDGKRLHGDNGGENDLGLIDPHNIERIEIVKGAQSALYGSDAIAGVINVITKKHDQSGIYLENTTRYGSYNDVRQHNGVGISIGKFNSYTNFQTQHTDGWQNTSQEYAEAKLLPDSRNKTVNKYTNWQVAERLTFTPQNNLEFYAEGSYYGKIINRPQDGNYPSCDVYTYDLMYRNASAGAGGKWKLNSTDVITLDVDWNKHAYYYKYTDTTLEDGYDPTGKFTNYYPYFAGQKNLQSDQQRTMAMLKGVFALPMENTLSAGMEYRYDFLNAPMRVKGGEASDWTAAMYVQDEFNLLEWFNLTAGVRLNKNQGFGFRATPKASAMFSLGDFRLRMGWSQGFKTPTPKELNYHYTRNMGAKTFFYMGNKDLKAQTSNYFTGGLEYRNSKFNASVTGYFNRLENMITLVNVPKSEIPEGETQYYGDGSSDLVPRMYKNMENAKTYGADVNITYTITKEITIGGNYSYLNTDANLYDEKTDGLKSVIIDGMAHHRWNAYATWQHRFAPKYRLGLGLYTRGSSMRYYQNDGNGKGYQIWKFGTTHEFGKSSSSLTYRTEAGVDNIFNCVDRTPRPYHLGTTTPPTTFYATFSIKFNQGKKVKKASLQSQKNDEE